MSRAITKSTIVESVRNDRPRRRRQGRGARAVAVAESPALTHCPTCGAVATLAGRCCCGRAFWDCGVCESAFHVW
jgi:hypothetical protein